ncbi:MAG: SDR family NAD(P)-dependent oxidoreductase [Polyangia bacterium]
MAGKVALITGGGGGIGRAAAQRLAEDGFELALLGRSHDQLDETAAEVQKCGRTAIPVVCDVRSAQEVQAAIESVLAQTGRIDVLVNNAGRGGGGNTVEMDDELWRDIIETNLSGVYYTTKTALKLAALTTIVNVSSTGGKQGVMFAAAYSASKHGVIGFTKSLALELAQKGVTVNAVCPGFVETQLAERAREGFARVWKVSVTEAKRRIEQRVPIGRYIEPVEVASMIGYLASSQARGITGQAFNVCGGLGNY